MKQHELEEARTTERLTGLLDGVLQYCEEEYGPSRDDLNARLARKAKHKELLNLILQRLAWAAAIIVAAVTLYKLAKP